MAGAGPFFRVGNLKGKNLLELFRSHARPRQNPRALLLGPLRVAQTPALF